MSGQERRPILVTGATGYIGGRLVPLLLDSGYRVRVYARSPRKVRARTWSDHPALEVVAGNVADPETTRQALHGCAAAYYLVHSMVTAGSDYSDRDSELARTFGAAASEAGCDRIIYLGGLGETGGDLSRHLASRRDVESQLAAGGVPVTVLRAAMIIGSGSASFEILRYLVERLPVMVTPRWVRTECQPIAVRNVLFYLGSCLETPETVGATLDIGGPEVLSYAEMMRIMARSLGLRSRLVVPLPFLTPRLSSLWIHLVTPLSHRIARPLAEGLRNRVVCRDDRAAQLMPQRLLTTREAIDAALGRLAEDEVETAWSDAGPIPGDPDWAGGTTFVDRHTIDVDATAEEVFAAVCRVGGGHGWYAADALWRIRGWLDRLVGGPGLRRGRRAARTIGYGDALDFWRVTGLEANRWLRLRAEMRLPGEALLEFEIEEISPGHSRLRQTARFQPRGLAGLAYWYAVLPLHGIVFRGMLEGIRRAAEEGGDGLVAARAEPGTSSS